MKRVKIYFLLISLVCLFLFVNSKVYAQATTDQSSKKSSSNLSSQSSDPTFPMMQFQIINTFAPSNYSGEGYANSFELQPAIPIKKSSIIPSEQIVRLSFPVVSTTSGPDRVTGLGDLSIFDLFVPDRFKWGAVGVGPMFVFPTATNEKLGAGKWQIGPAGSIVVDKVKNFIFGVIVQNPISVGGNHNRENVNTMIVQPIIQYNLPVGEWYISIGDFNWTFDWTNNGKSTIPLALQLGKIVKMGKFNYNISIEGAKTVAYEGTYPKSLIKVGFSLLIPEKK